MNNFKKNRVFLKSDFKNVGETAQKKGLEQPGLVKEYDESSNIIKLPEISEDMDIFKERDLYNCINKRETRRLYSKEENINLDKLSYILWATQGVKRIRKEKTATIRTVPSAGARHPLETYIVVINVEGLKKGLYRYLPMEHSILLEYENNKIEEDLIEASSKQIFVGNSAATLIWTAIPYRTEWRYGAMAYKSALIDVGHVCQNLYLVCESLNLGTCAIAAYDQIKTEKFLKVDGIEEIPIYMAPIGVRKN